MLAKTLSEEELWADFEEWLRKKKLEEEAQAASDDERPESRQIPGAMPGFRFPGRADTEMEKAAWMQRARSGDAFGGAVNLPGGEADRSPYTPMPETSADLEMYRAISENRPPTVDFTPAQENRYGDMLRLERERSQAVMPGVAMRIAEDEAAAARTKAEAGEFKGWLEAQFPPEQPENTEDKRRTLKRDALFVRDATALGFPNIDAIPEDVLDDIAMIAGEKDRDRHRKMMEEFKAARGTGRAGMPRLGALGPGSLKPAGRTWVQQHGG